MSNVSTSSALASVAQSATGARRVVLSSQLLWPEEEEPNPLPIFTLLIWLMCLFIGALGFVLHYERPRPRKPPEPPVFAQQMKVELVPTPPPDVKPPPPDLPSPPPAPDELAPPAIAQPIAVARPSPAIAFAVPVAGPIRVVDASRAAANTRAAPPPAQQLTFREGEGKQPAPDYPRLAELQRQEGTVTIRLTVGESGKVLTAEAVQKSPWPLLNEAALKTVRERWHFHPGQARVYEVDIRFQLTK